MGTGVMRGAGLAAGNANRLTLTGFGLSFLSCAPSSPESTGGSTLTRLAVMVAGPALEMH